MGYLSTLQSFVNFKIQLWYLFILNTTNEEQLFFFYPPVGFLKTRFKKLKKKTKKKKIPHITMGVAMEFYPSALCPRVLGEDTEGFHSLGPC